MCFHTEVHNGENVRGCAMFGVLAPVLPKVKIGKRYRGCPPGRLIVCFPYSIDLGLVVLFAERESKCLSRRDSHCSAVVRSGTSLPLFARTFLKLSHLPASILLRASPQVFFAKARPW